MYDKISFFWRVSRVWRTISTFCYLVQIKKDRHPFYRVMVLFCLVHFISFW